MSPSWPEKIQRKRQECREAIPSTWKIPTEILAVLKTPIESHENNIIELDLIRKSRVLSCHELDITEKNNVEQLLDALASGALTAVEVTVAYSKRAAVAQQLVNCLTETYFEQALERAKHLDNLRAQGRLAGPLHGLPVSLKDSFQIAGSQATLGVVSYLDHISERNSPLVDVLLSLGAVVYVKTNVPQTLATVDTDNNILGRTVNPWNTTLGAGGSSGGEGALVALHGSPLGVGTDVGGSIRIPSLCCGKDCTEPGMDFMLPSAGPLSHDINALEIFMKRVINAEPAQLDSSVIDVPWRSVPKLNTHLRIGLLPEDPRFPLHPTVKHTVTEAVRKLRAQGHTIIPLDVAKCHIADSTETAWKFFMIDDAAYKHSRFIPDLNGRDRLSRLALFRAMRAMIMDDWRKIWVDQKLDLVLAPSAQSTAVKHNRFGLPAYTTLTNVLDVCCLHSVLK
ncbi:amidase signature domain-containing protein [Aspergillus avenaceus]|uniref:amidase n=1 Tax=Aspergillus avenaceus TaxID=36643 RepID=A0A5N6UAV2_ASPAV|nr:amidase signature domain-containing protein [Aspergillus avenaceus]